jgi:alcohol dehydrogenase class IV
MTFDFATAATVRFGSGCLADVGPLAVPLGRRALVVTGRTPHRADLLVERLIDAGVECTSTGISGEPTVDDIRRATGLARDLRCELVVGFGGGSALDAAKAVAMLLGNGGDPMDYLEVIGQGRPITQPSVPCIAVPTTAGTGSEVTRNAVLSSPQHGVKASLRSPFLLPRIALVDPDLTLSVPRPVTVATGMDALTQLLEPFVSVRANPVTDGLCREGLARAARSLRRVCAHGRDAAARADMALASLLGGMALANAGLGAVHGFAAVIGGSFAAPHGAVCARLLAPVCRANVAALRARGGGSDAPARYDEAARVLTGRPGATADDLVAWLEALAADLGVPPLSAHGMAEADIPTVVRRSAQASSMKGNPIALRPDEMAQVLLHALGAG